MFFINKVFSFIQLRGRVSSMKPTCVNNKLFEIYLWCLILERSMTNSCAWESVQIMTLWFLSLSEFMYMNSLLCYYSLVTKCTHPLVILQLSMLRYYEIYLKEFICRHHSRLRKNWSVICFDLLNNFVINQVVFKGCNLFWVNTAEDAIANTYHVNTKAVKHDAKRCSAQAFILCCLKMFHQEPTHDTKICGALSPNQCCIKMFYREPTHDTKRCNVLSSILCCINMFHQDPAHDTKISWS